jgi:hypothetical protein
MMCAYDDNYHDPGERESLSAEDDLLATLLAEYIVNREQGAPAMSLLPELQARAAEFGDRAATNFEELVVYWELKRVEGDA